MLARFHAEPSDRVYKPRNRKEDRRTTREREREKMEKKKMEIARYDDDDDNVERLLTKIEVVVMTGIGRDDALREGRNPCRLSQLLEKDFMGRGDDSCVLCVRVYAQRRERGGTEERLRSAMGGKAGKRHKRRN